MSRPDPALLAEWEAILAEGGLAPVEPAQPSDIDEISDDPSDEDLILIHKGWTPISDGKHILEGCRMRHRHPHPGGE